MSGQIPEQQRKLAHPPLTTGSRTENLVKNQPVVQARQRWARPNTDLTLPGSFIGKRSRIEGRGEWWAVLP